MTRFRFFIDVMTEFTTLMNSVALLKWRQKPVYIPMIVFIVPRNKNNIGTFRKEDIVISLFHIFGEQLIVWSPSWEIGILSCNLLIASWMMQPISPSHITTKYKYFLVIKQPVEHFLLVLWFQYFLLHCIMHIEEQVEGMKNLVGRDTKTSFSKISPGIFGPFEWIVLL